jgi:hypothetical protein
MEKMVDSMDRINRIKIGMSKGVFIHVHSCVRLFSSKKALKASRVTKCMTLTAHPWTEPIARGVKMSKE